MTLLVIDREVSPREFTLQRVALHLMFSKKDIGHRAQVGDLVIAHVLRGATLSWLLEIERPGEREDDWIYHLQPVGIDGPIYRWSDILLRVVDREWVQGFQQLRWREKHWAFGRRLHWHLKRGLPRHSVWAIGVIDLLSDEPFVTFRRVYDSGGPNNTPRFVYRQPLTGWEKMTGAQIGEAVAAGVAGIAALWEGQKF